MRIFLSFIAASGAVMGIAGIGDCNHMTHIGANAWYNWSPDTGSDCAGFVPMVRDASQAERLQAGLLEMHESDIILGFNEPDLCPYQACISPIEAVPVERWRLTTYTDTLHASPAPSQDGVAWLPTMRQLYIDEYGEPPGWDYLAAHCYVWDALSLRACKATITQHITWAEDWDADGVLVTEFAAFAFRYHPDHDFNYAPAVELGRELIEWMNEQEEIQGYFWFSAHDWGVWHWSFTTALYDESETLTPLGDMYKEAINARRETGRE